LKTGKPSGIDIKEHKMTLPVIYTLQNCDSSTKRFIINTIKNDSEHKEKVNKVVNLVIETGGVDYAKQKMDEFRTQANEVLKFFPDNTYRKSLHGLIQYTIDRER
jgi:octaprenyl-diphosphate synthase